MISSRIVLLGLIPILIFLFGYFILPSFLNAAVNIIEEEAGKSELVVQESKEVVNFEVERISESFLFMTAHNDFVRLYFKDGTAEVIDRPSKLLLDKGSENMFDVYESHYVKTDRLADTEKVLVLDEEQFEKFTREYVVAFNKTPTVKE